MSATVSMQARGVVLDFREQDSIIPGGIVLAERPTRPLSPIQRLPHEIISYIFIHAIPTTYAPATKAEWPVFLSNIFPLNIAAVCRAWRQEAMRTDELWNTFFFEMGSPSRTALSAFERCLRKLLIRSASSCTSPQRGLTVGIRFLGEFDHLLASEVVRPLLRHQRRWECIEIYFGGMVGVAKGLSLNMSELVSLKSLKLHGMFWNINRRAVTLENIGTSASVAVEGYPIELPLSKLVSLQLLGVQQSASMTLIGAARSIQELFISIDIEPPFKRRRAQLVRLESLKKLTIVNEFEDIDVLNTFECPALEELSLIDVSSATLRQLEVFNHTTNGTLRSLKLKVGADSSCLTNDNDWFNLYLNLIELPGLKMLSIAAGKYLLEGKALPQLSIYGFEEFRDCCTRLEELHLEGILDDEDRFTDLVETHWTGKGRTIRKMTFHNCMTMNEQGEPERMYSIEGVGRYEEEGLELNVTCDPSASYEVYRVANRSRSLFL